MTIDQAIDEPSSKLTIFDAVASLQKEVDKESQKIMPRNEYGLNGYFDINRNKEDDLTSIVYRGNLTQHGDVVTMADGSRSFFSSKGAPFEEVLSVKYLSSLSGSLDSNHRLSFSDNSVYLMVRGKSEDMRKYVDVLRERFGEPIQETYA